MSLNDAIEQAKIQEQEKEAISLKVPANLKHQLQKIAEENRISMNNLISSILNDVVNGSISNNAYQLYQEFKKISDEIIEISDTQSGIPFGGFSIKPEELNGNETYISTLISKYKVLKNLLGDK
jgi:hypothetical protein